MKQRTTNALTGSGQGLLVILMAFCLLAVGSPVQADPPGSEYVGIIGPLGSPGIVEAADGTPIEMLGTVEFRLSPGKEILGGGGTFKIGDGAGAIEGEWHPIKLKGFHSEGRCVDSQDCLDGVFEIFGLDGTTWEAGKMTAKIHLEGVGYARLVIWCRLPGIKLPNPNGFPESFRVDMSPRSTVGPIHFDSQSPTLTLFVRTAD